MNVWTMIPIILAITFVLLFLTGNILQIIAAVNGSLKLLNAGDILIYIRFILVLAAIFFAGFRGQFIPVTEPLMVS